MCRGCDPWIVVGAVLVVTNFVEVSSFRSGVGQAPLPTAPSPSPPSLTQSIGDFQSSVNQQSIQSVLNAIEQRLRGLDSIYAVRYGAAGGVVSAGGLTRDTLDARLSRLESTYDLRLQTLTESLLQKYSLLVHKVDVLFDRVRYIETGQNKIQVTTTKTSEKQINIADRIETVARAVTRIEQQQIRANGTLYAIEQRLQAVAVSIDSIGTSSSIQTVSSEGHCSLNSSDIMNEIEGAVSTIREHVDRKADMVLNKASNSYNDMYRHVTSTESLVKATLSVANSTKLQLQQVLNADSSVDPAGAPSVRGFPRNPSPLLLSSQITDNGQLVTLVETLAKYISNNMKVLEEHSEERFTEITKSIEAFNEGCQGMQSDFGNKISAVLTKLLDLFGEKNTEISEIDSKIHVLQELLKSHDTHVVNVISRTTKAVHNVSEMSTERDKELQRTITELFQNASHDTKQIQQTIEGAFSPTQSSNPEIVSTMNGIAAAVQGLRDQLNCFNSSCALHSLLKNMSSELEKTFVSTCGKSGYAEKYHVSYDEAWASILGKKNSTDALTEDVTNQNMENYSGTDPNVTDIDSDNDDVQQSGKDMGLALDLTTLEDDDYINDDDEDVSEVNYK